jgi:hypothetical protein
MTKPTISLLHWNYFLALESDLSDLSRYIEFTSANFDTYSIELAHLLLASASEVDVKLKELCYHLDHHMKVKNIDDYRRVIKDNLPEFLDEKVYIPRYNISFTPWLEWKSDSNPEWWGSYNNVKHERNKFFSDANLKNVIHSMGGLFVAENYFYMMELRKNSPTIDLRKTIFELELKSEFIKFDEGYYPKILVTE